MSYAGCWRPGRIGPVIAMTLLSACGTAGSEHGACPPVVEYSAEEQRRAAGEVEALPQGSVVVVMMADYHILRQQTQVCQLSHLARK